MIRKIPNRQRILTEAGSTAAELDSDASGEKVFRVILSGQILRGRSRKKGVSMLGLKTRLIPVFLLGILVLSGCGRQKVQELVIDTSAGPLFEDTGITEISTALGGVPEESETEEDPEISDAYAIVLDPEVQTETDAAIIPETEAETMPETEMPVGPVAQAVNSYLKDREAKGEKWAIAYEDLATGEQYDYQSGEKMQSASVIKLFIMGAVYQYMCYPENEDEVINFGEDYDGQLRETIENMIRVSDNDAANLLIERLGRGDFQAGAGMLKKFCAANGYTETSLGRRFLEENPDSDNYISANDVRKILSDLYHGRLVNEDASAKMLEILKGQTLTGKIPSGLPEGFSSANKTGEIPEGYGLGCIENDSAICFAPEGSGEGFILVILSNELGGRNEEAQSVIRSIASDTASWYLNEKNQNPAPEGQALEATQKAAAEAAPPEAAPEGAPAAEAPAPEA